MIIVIIVISCITAHFPMNLWINFAYGLLSEGTLSIAEFTTFLFAHSNVRVKRN